MDLRAADNFCGTPFTQMSEYADETPAPPIIAATLKAIGSSTRARQALSRYQRQLLCLALGCRPLEWNARYANAAEIFAFDCWGFRTFRPSSFQNGS
jgi:hypothetical protein